MTDSQDALYYPFHLCSEETLTRLLQRFRAIHFHDYMALRLTSFFGTTAFNDRMGDSYPQLVAAGRLIEGHQTSGALDPSMEAAVDRDLADSVWRKKFHQAFSEERRFQRGLFDPPHGIIIGRTVIPAPAALLRFMNGLYAERFYTVETVRQLSVTRPALPEAYELEYGVALIKTAASGVWTVRIAREHRLSVVTDSAGHYALLQRSCDREGIALTNHFLARHEPETAVP